jgi:putative ATP-dependent endonuclease of the OLD family
VCTLPGIFIVPIEGLGKYKNKSIDGIGKNLEEERQKAENRYSGQKVKSFVSKYWTLEYDLACSELKRDFYRAVLYADYLKNSDKIGLTERKKQKADRRVEEDFNAWEAKWNKDTRKDRKIAFKIYNDIMLKKGQLKSITAQCFAEIIERKAKEGDSEKVELKKIFETDEHLKYLIDAIKYAAIQ